MAGHSQFANIKHRKGAQDKKRASMFTKLAKEIVVAAKTGGGNPEFNPRLRAAVIDAREANMPKDRIEAAIKKATSPGDAENYDELRYEGYAPGGVALIIDILTDNRNRSASDIRSLLTKHGGNLGEMGSVNFMFDRVGMVLYPIEKASADAMFEAALDAGANDCSQTKTHHEITCDPTQLHTLREALVKKFGDPESARLAWKPNVLNAVDYDKAVEVLELIEALEDHDDVQHVTTNIDLSDEIAEKLVRANSG